MIAEPLTHQRECLLNGKRVILCARFVVGEKVNRNIVAINNCVVAYGESGYCIPDGKIRAFDRGPLIDLLSTAHNLRRMLSAASRVTQADLHLGLSFALLPTPHSFKNAVPLRQTGRLGCYGIPSHMP